ncbi:MAG: ComE operon protein 1 [Syntrophus sp. PtaB.Bin001]|nr:MAG: ComE operon protein 1 [Syntrophus sp. PtaB.Bin001]
MKKGHKIILTRIQLCGSVFVAFLAIIISLSIFLYNENFHALPKIPYGYQSKDCMAVEIDGNVWKGILFLPEGLRLNDLLKTMNIENISKIFSTRNIDASMFLKDCSKITVIRRNNDDTFIDVENLTATTRLVLKRPININSASLEDFVLVPGIGEKTAQKIIGLRNKQGKFKQLEEIMNIKGIKQKKFEKLRGYLYIGEI